MWRSNLLLFVGCCLCLWMLTAQPHASEQKPTPPAASKEKPAEPQPLTAAEQTEALLDLLGIEKPTPSEVVEAFVVLGAKEGMKPTDSPDVKARYFIASMRTFVYHNCKQVELAKAEAAFNSQFKVRDDTPADSPAVPPAVPPKE